MLTLGFWPDSGGNATVTCHSTADAGPSHFGREGADHVQRCTRRFGARKPARRAGDGNHLVPLQRRDHRAQPAELGPPPRRGLLQKSSTPASPFTWLRQEARNLHKTGLCSLFCRKHMIGNEVFMIVNDEW